MTDKAAAVLGERPSAGTQALRRLPPFAEASWPSKIVRGVVGAVRDPGSPRSQTTCGRELV